MTAPTAPNRAARRAKPAPAPAAAKPRSVTVDLDAQRAARREARGERVEVVLGGIVYQLPAELPLEAVEPLAQLAELQDEDGELAEGVTEAGQLRIVRTALAASLAALICDEGLDSPRDDEDQVLAAVSAHSDSCAWPSFSRQRPSLEDQLALWEGLFDAYGVSLGEALARIGSPSPDGAP